MSDQTTQSISTPHQPPHPRGLIGFVEAIGKGNSVDYQLQVADMATTISIGMVMMSLQRSFTKLLNSDVDKIIQDAADTNLSRADQLKYKEDNIKMDSQTNQMRTMFDTAKQQVTSDTEAQKNIVSTDESVVSVQSTLTNLVQRGGSYGK